MCLRSEAALRKCLLCVCASLAILPAGCWWQRDTYNARMLRTLANWEKEAELARLLGEPYQPPGEFALWIRPPKPRWLRS